MTEQPRRKDGRFAEKFVPAPHPVPNIPRKDIGKELEDYNALGSEQESVLSEGFSSVGNSLDHVIAIYKARQERANKQIEENTARLKAISDELDRLTAEREAIAEELRQRQERSPWNRLKRLFK